MFYLLDKEKGISSYRAIKEFAKQNNIKKIGHTGTLDPMATGLLLIATDDDTKLIDYIDKGKKTYIVEMELNKKSNTLDSDGEIEKLNYSISKKDIIPTIKSFEKEYMQIPPSFSAKKINGKRSYELARKGIEIKLNPNLVKIFEIKNINKINDESYSFEVSVSRGTYIRSLIRDIGESLGTSAIMTNLRRVEVAGINIKEANKKIDEKRLIDLPIIQIENYKKLFAGQKIIIKNPNGKYAVIFKEKIVGIIELKDNLVVKRRLFGIKYERLLNESS